MLAGNVDTLLFDLDGTLLPLDLEKFMYGYFQALVAKLEGIVTQEELISKIWASTKEMIENENSNVTNIEKFKTSFFLSTGLEESKIWPIFDDFYKTEFYTLRQLTNPTTIAREICRTALDKGYQVIVATNPIFPQEAIEARLMWAGIQDLPFTLVTTMENMHYCKPNPKYFIEILERIQRLPNQCMMFGNDVQEDGVAEKIGIETFLVDDYLIDRNIGHIEFSHRGSFMDVLKFVENLPRIK